MLDADVERGRSAGKWLEHVETYERAFEKWEKRVEKIIDLYMDKGRESAGGTDSSKHNILWSNVQTLTAATYSRVPKPDVSRRFKDQDPVGRVAGTILERALEYEVQKYSTYASTLKSVVQDRFLGGRGTAWVRYEPHFKAAGKQQPQDGLGITEDVDEPREELDYECAPCDYIHWRDFGHVVARTWEEVPAVWRKVYLTREQCNERFGEEIGRSLPLDASPDDAEKRKAGNQSTTNQSRALIYEIWDKTTKQAVWISKSLNRVIDLKSDPLGLDDFFPCPRPLFSTLGNDSLIPVPDYTVYQDQANSLNLLSGRISGLLKALKVAGGYDASVPELARIFTEGTNNTLIPVKNWAAFAEKQGLQGTISIVDLTPIVNALHAAYEAVGQIMQQIYDITGLSDIIRGQTAANETATAQQIKGQYATLRLKVLQDDVARFATEILRIQSQIICKQFAPRTLMEISAANQLPADDQQLIPRAIQLLTQQGPNPIRMFRIDVAADSLIQIDETQEKQDRMEFLQAISGFIEKVAPIGQMQPALLPMIGELLKFGTRSFKAGKSMEGAIDNAIDGMSKQPPPQDPAAAQQAEKQRKQLQDAQEKLQTGQAALMQERQQLDQERLSLSYDQKLLGIQKEAAAKSVQADFAEKEAARVIAENNAGQNIKSLLDDLNAAREEYTRMCTGDEAVAARNELRQSQTSIASAMQQNHVEAMRAVADAVKAMSAPKRVIRDQSGRAASVETPPE